MVLRGPGRIEASIKERIRFFLYGTATDGAAAFRKIVMADSNPYDAGHQLRLFATDYGGNEWAGGITEARPFTDHKHGWPMSGQLAGIATQVSGPWVSGHSSVELMLVPPPSLPMGEAMTSSTSIGDDVVLATRRPGRQIVEALGSSITFVNDASEDAMWITARTSAELAHPYAERWLCEPLRVMLGTPIHPRLIARNFGDGTATVMLLPAYGNPEPTAFGLVQSLDIRDRHGAAFWNVYSDLLVMVGRARDTDGPGLMDGHHVTRLYEEVSQAARGSRWVMLLTLASTIEALAKSLMGPDDKISEFAPEALASRQSRPGMGGQCRVARPHARPSRENAGEEPVRILAQARPAWGDTRSLRDLAENTELGRAWGTGRALVYPGRRCAPTRDGRAGTCPDARTDIGR